MKEGKKKKIVIAISIIIIILIAIGVIKIFNNEEENKLNIVEQVESDNEFAAYSLKNIQINDSNVNLIFLDDIDGKGKEELNVKVGDTYSFNGETGIQYTIEVLELTDDYIIISIDGLAPRKKTGGFSLIDDYDKITIKKNTGVCLNEQATDLLDGSVYFFYVK